MHYELPFTTDSVQMYLQQYCCDCCASLTCTLIAAAAEDGTELVKPEIAGGKKNGLGGEVGNSTFKL